MWPRLILLVTALSLSLGVVGPAGAELTPEALAKNIEKMLSKGQELDACWMAKRMAPFGDSEAYKALGEVMREHGLSIQSPLESYTLKKMVELQNLLENQRRTGQREPEPATYAKYPDGWGNPLRVELITHGAYVYLVRSAGPDQRFFTDDDMVVGTRKTTADKMAMPDMRKEEKAGVPEARNVGRRSLMSRPTGKSPAGPDPSELGRPSAGGAGEREVNLEDLLKK